jgi:hypothetical protein
MRPGAARLSKASFARPDSRGRLSLRFYFGINCYFGLIPTLAPVVMSMYT